MIVCKTHTNKNTKTDRNKRKQTNTETVRALSVCISDEIPMNFFYYETCELIINLKFP